MGKEADADAYGHHQQGKAKDGIDAPDELVDGEDGSQDIVDEDDDTPPHRRGEEAPPWSEGAEQTGRGDDEDRRNKHEQHDGEDAREHQRSASQFVPGYLGQCGTALAHAHHATEIIVDSTGKDASEDNPQIGGRTEKDAHDGTEDGACAGNVEKLDEIDLPCRKGHVVHTVGLGETRCRTAVVGAEHFFYQGAVDKIAQKKGNE